MRAKPVYDQIICFGDSLTEFGSQTGGFVASLQNEYKRRFEVISRGFSGYTSRQAIALCPILFTPDSSEEGSKAKLATIWFGTNDSVAPGFGQYVPIDEYEKNMTQVLEHFASTDVLLITPGTVVPGRVENHLTDESMVQYGQRLYRVADTVNSQRQARGESGKIAVVNMNAAFLSAAEKVEGGIASLLVDDGLHINQAGYEVVFKAVKDAILTNFPHLHPDVLPPMTPYWRELDMTLDEEGQKKQLQPFRRA